MKLKRITLLTVSLVAVAIGGLLSPAAAHADPGAVAFTPYWIKFRHSNKCADNNFSTANGALYAQWTCARNINQYWNFEPIGTDGVGRTAFQIRNRYSGKCMHVSTYRPGAAVYQQPCAGSSSRAGKWVFDRLYSSTPSGWYYLINDWGAQCLNVRGNSLLDGADLIAYNCQPGAQNEMVQRIPAS